MTSGAGGPQQKRLYANGFTLTEVLVALMLLPVVIQLIIGITHSVMQVQQRWIVRQTETDWHMLLIQLPAISADLRRVRTSASSLDWYFDEAEERHFHLKNDKLMMTTTKGGNITVLYEVDTAASYFETKKKTTTWHIQLKGRGYYNLETPAPS